VAYVEADIAYALERLTDLIRTDTDLVNRLGLTAVVRAEVGRALDEVEHDAIIALYKRIGYRDTRALVPWRRLSDALRLEAERNPVFARGGLRVKAHLPNP
jgi:hypothetical protein